MQPLADTLRRAPIPPGEAIALAAALADALAAKVREKTRPPRITPGAVLIGRRDDGTLAVEFKSGALPAPPGAAGADERAAVQELGVICYRLLTGKPPIKGNVALIRDLETAVASSEQPDAVKALVLELISVDPARRPGLEAAAERLIAISRGTSLPKGPSSPAPLPPPPRAGSGTRPPPTPTKQANPSIPAAKPTPPPIAAEPAPPPVIESASGELVPAAPVLPTDSIVVASKTKKKKNSTDTQERLFFAEGERLEETLRADAAADAQAAAADGEGGDKTDLEVERVGGAAWWQNKRILAAAAGGVVLLGILLYVVFGRGGGGSDEKPEPLAAADNPASSQEQVDTAKVAAAPEPEPPVAAPEPEPPAPEPAPEPEPPVAEPAPEPPAAEPEAPAAKRSKSSSSKKSSSKQAKPTPPPAPVAKPKETPKPVSSDPMAQAKAARSKGKSAEAYKYYSQAAKGKNAASATFGMAEMAYAMKKHSDAIKLAKKAMSLGASQKSCWKIIAKSHCARGEGRSAWFAFSKAGGGDCK